MIILIDTREKQNKHILDYFDTNKIKYQHKKLNAGDYSFVLDGASYENIIAVERKGSITEICGNFANGKERFEREFQRARLNHCKVILMIEGSLEQIDSGDYRSRFSPAEIKNRLNTWCYKYHLKLNFVEKETAGSFIIETFKKHLEGSNKNV